MKLLWQTSPKRLETLRINKEQTARKGLGNLRTRTKPLQSVRQRNKPFERDERICEQRGNGSKGIREFQNEEQTTGKGLASLRTKSKPSQSRTE